VNFFSANEKRIFFFVYRIAIDNALLLLIESSKKYYIKKNKKQIFVTGNWAGQLVINKIKIKKNAIIKNTLLSAYILFL